MKWAKEENWTILDRQGLPITVEPEFPEWQPIETAPHDEGWIKRCLFAKRYDWGWSVWVGQRDSYDMWLGVQDGGGCWDCEVPTHWMPIPSPPVDTF